MRHALILALVAVCAAPSVLPGANPHDYDPLLWSPLVVHGVVENVGPRYFTHDQLYPNGPAMENPPGSLYRMNVIEVNVIQVLKGRFPERVFRAWNSDVDFGKLLDVGQEIVICAQQNPYFFGGTYVAQEPNDVYAKSDGFWVRGIQHPVVPPPDSRADVFVSEPIPDVTFEEIVERAERSSMPVVAREADLIVLGDVMAVEPASVAGVTDVSLVTLDVHKTLKGDPATIRSFIMRHDTHGVEYGTLNSYIPMLPAIGEQWLVFLKAGPDGYFPFAGENSLLRVEGDRLIYGPVGGSAPYTRSQLEQLVMDKAGDDK
ncbi:MAG TPA: hypothetical protein VFX92_14590 [Candidatus Krumholzibacteria bacterium]|nr:hypothetical protein [Candidatus Krumholzibacteria bacterium]